MRRSARAFSHLQKCIIADDEIQTCWAAAFAKGETACEKLGAAHLLLHGIYAFKVDATGARTEDLVLSQPIVDEEVFQVAEGLVLTEWKKIPAAREVGKQAASAKKQAELYASEPLARSGAYFIQIYRAGFRRPHRRTGEYRREWNNLPAHQHLRKSGGAER
jgi:hypothetical protein